MSGFVFFDWPDWVYRRLAVSWVTSLLMVTLCGEIRLFGEGELAVIVNPFPCNQIQRGYLFFHLVKSLLGHVAQHTRRMKMGLYLGERGE